jgi:hypothetical protein
MIWRGVKKLLTKNLNPAGIRMPFPGFTPYDGT